MDKKHEKLIQALMNISIIPSIDGAIMLSDEIADVTGFQIKCDRNNEGRTVFSVHGHTEGDMTYNESLEIFKEKYQEIYDKVPEQKKDVNTINFPTAGSDYINDIHPSTMVKMIVKSIENNDEAMTGCLDAYIMRLTQEISRWEKHFTMLSNKTTLLRKVFEQILEEN